MVKKKTDKERFSEYLNRISSGNAPVILSQAIQFSSKKKKK